jgi:hypothetical protein
VCSIFGKLGGPPGGSCFKNCGDAWDVNLLKTPTNENYKLLSGIVVLNALVIGTS